MRYLATALIVSSFVILASTVPLTLIRRQPFLDELASVPDIVDRAHESADIGHYTENIESADHDRKCLKGRNVTAGCEEALASRMPF